MVVTAKGTLTAELTELIGPLQARKLIDRFCYRQLYIPVKPMTESHPIVACIGPEDAAKLQAAYRGLRIQIPRCAHVGIAERNQAILDARSDGASVADLVQEFSLCPRSIYYVLAKG